jgi:hypothetical protein
MNEQPKTVMWFRIYAGALAVTYALTAVLGALMVLFGDNMPRHHQDLPAKLEGVLYMVVAVPLCALFAVGVPSSRARWRWAFGFVLLAIGTMSCCCLPVVIPIMVMWLKPDVKEWFGA